MKNKKDDFIKSVKHRVGAPPGLTVHWLAEELTGAFSLEYKLSYNRKHHNYDMLVIVSGL